MKLIISNLPSSITQESIRELLSPYGDVESVQILIDKDTGIFMGVALIVMPSSVEADEAIAALDGAEYDGQQLSVTQTDGIDFPSDEYWN